MRRGEHGPRFVLLTSSLLYQKRVPPPTPLSLDQSRIPNRDTRLSILPKASNDRGSQPILRNPDPVFHAAEAEWVACRRGAQKSGRGFVVAIWSLYRSRNIQAASAARPRWSMLHSTETEDFSLHRDCSLDRCGLIRYRNVKCRCRHVGRFQPNAAPSLQQRTERSSLGELSTVALPRSHRGQVFEGGASAEERRKQYGGHRSDRVEQPRLSALPFC